MSTIVNPSAPPDKSDKYALRERERRFLLAGLPDAPIVASARITDYYLTGTRLRLRRSVETADGSTSSIYKLTQKVPAPDGAPGLITTLYLTQIEYDAIATLPRRELRKTRYSMPPLGVDVFEPPLHGLTLAEASFSSDEAARAFVPPPFAVAEVTQDIRFTGGYLAAATWEDLREALASYGIRLS